VPELLRRPGSGRQHLWSINRRRSRTDSNLGTLEAMQLRNARLCLDCEEVHDAQQCPVCTSEMYVPITRWVEAPERRTHSRPAPSSSRAEIYRALIDAENRPSRTRQLLKGGALGVAALGVLGWFMRRPSPPK
jgi:hypothetical protein